MAPEKTDISKNRMLALENELRVLLTALDEFMPVNAAAKKSSTPKSQFVDLKSAMDELSITLAEHAKYLNKHINALENLTLAVKQLDSSIKKEVSLASKQPSIELKEAINSFLEYQINPQFYHEPGYLKLPVASDGIYPETGKKAKHQKQKPSENE